MRQVLTAVMLIALSAAAGSASAEVREVTVKGLGNKPCSEWTKAHQPRKPEAVLQETWLTGFISGFNEYALKDSKDVAPGIGLSAIQTAVSAYCSSRPNDTLYRASKALVLDLQKKSGAK